MSAPTTQSAPEGAPEEAAELVEALVLEITRRVAEKLDHAPARRFLSKQALAEHLGVSQRRIKTLRERGLPARKVGGTLFFDLDEVYAFIDREGHVDPAMFNRQAIGADAHQSSTRLSVVAGETT